MPRDEAIEKAVRHVSDNWLPPQKEVLDKIRLQLDSGIYETNRTQFATDLKEDFALYMYCLRELTRIVEEQQKKMYPGLKEQQIPKVTPAELFEKADLNILKNIFGKEDHEISSHSIEQMNEFQALRFQESILSASTAEVLATKVEVDPEIGFSCGLLRQLGLTLIAWNYPRVYSRAMETLTDNESLDLMLTRVLGFSPSLLGLTFAKKWNLSEDILHALGEKRRPVLGKDDNQSQKVGDLLGKICEVGEAFARANNPEHYPSALNDWEAAEETIAKHLGNNGVQLIFQRAHEHCKEYLKRSPELKEFAESSVIKERIVDSRYASSRLEKNVHLKQCPPHIKECISKLYHQFKPNKILKKNVQTLVFEIIPQCGFKRGCIFMLEPASRVLNPAIKIGELAPERTKPIKLSSVLSHFDLVSSAFSLKSPLREEGIDENGKRTTVIAAALGLSAPMGVVYLETSENFLSEIGPDPLPVFRAIRQTLSDCLNLL